MPRNDLPKEKSWGTSHILFKGPGREQQLSALRCQTYESNARCTLLKHIIYILSTWKKVQGQQSAKSEERSWDASDSCLRIDKHIYWEELGPQKPQLWHFQGTRSKLDGPFQFHSWIRTQNKLAWHKTSAYARPPSPSYCFCFSFSSLVLISGSHTEHLAV